MHWTKSQASVSRLLVLAVIFTFVSCNDENVAKSDRNIGQKLIDSIKSEYRMRELFYSNNNDGGLMFPRADKKKERELMQTIDHLSPADIERLGHDTVEQPPFDQWLKEKVKSVRQKGKNSSRLALGLCAT